MDKHLQDKATEADRMFRELTADAPKLENGLPEQPFRREAEQAVLATLIEFPPDDGSEMTPEPPMPGTIPPPRSATA